MIPITINKAKEILKKVIISGNKKPMFLHSSPGLGKSAIIKQLGLELGYRVIDIRLGSIEASDLCGIPYVHDGVQKWSVPTWFPTKAKEKVILFLDELSNASIPVQHAGYRLVHDREIQDGTRLPDSVIVIAAGNLKTDKTGVKGIAPALANRFGIHFQIEPNLEDFINYGVRAGISEQIIGFLNFDASKLYGFDPLKDDLAFPTPRSWEAVSGLLDCGFDESELTVAISGCVGPGVANEFLAYRKHFADLPDFTKIANGESTYVVPNDNIGLVFAVSSSLIYHLIANASDKKKMVNLVKVMEQLGDEYLILIFKCIRGYGDKDLIVKIHETTKDLFAKVERYVKIKK